MSEITKYTEAYADSHDEYITIDCDVETLHNEELDKCKHSNENESGPASMSTQGILERCTAWTQEVLIQGGGKPVALLLAYGFVISNWLTIGTTAALIGIISASIYLNIWAFRLNDA